MQSDIKPRVRFAPSPTGEVHLGSARTALYNYLLAKKTGGKFLLRIEDTDQTRYVPGAMERFFADLKWLGLSWDEGPDIGGSHAPYVQSERTALYREAADRLVASGNAYRCWCTPERLAEMREAQMAAKQPPKYDRHCLSLTEDEQKANTEKPFVVRLKVPVGTTTFVDAIRGEVTFENALVDDQVLLKSDGFPTYHLAAVVDDHAWKITHVIRGEEWLPSTPKHLMLYASFGWEPPIFAHLSLILATDKKKLSKRIHGEAVWLATYRSQGYLPEALVNYLAFLGWNPGTEREFYSLDELAQEFELERVHKAGAIFDAEKLRFFNAHYLRRLTDEQILEQLKDGNFLGLGLADLADDQLVKFITIHRDRMATFGEFTALVAPLVAIDDYAPELLIFRKSDAERTRLGLELALQALSKAPTVTWESRDELQVILTAVIRDNGLTNGDVFWPVRVALSGQAASAAPVELLWALGPVESVKRLELAVGKF